MTSATRTSGLGFVLKGAGVVATGGLVAALLASSALACDVTPTRLLNAANEPQNWLTVHGNYSSTRFSKLSQINNRNVDGLKLAFAVPLGGTQKSWISGGALEGTPLVDNGIMYVANGWGETYRIDVSSGR